MSQKNITNTIKDWMDSMHENFPEIFMEYAYQMDLNFHVIEVSPSYVEESKDFAKEYMCFIRNFYNDFPNTNILITEKDYEGINDMSNLVYMVKPKTENDIKFDIQNIIELYTKESNFYRYVKPSQKLAKIA